MLGLKLRRFEFLSKYASQNPLQSISYLSSQTMQKVFLIMWPVNVTMHAKVSHQESKESKTCYKVIPSAAPMHTSNEQSTGKLFESETMAE